MKKILEDLLVCPECGGSLEAKTFVSNEEDIIEGILRCKCGQAYPIVGSIPRMLIGSIKNYPEFIRRHNSELDEYIHDLSHKRKRESDGINKWTQKSFGYQWSRFGKMACDFRENFFNYIHPIQPSFFKGKMGLDVGCGFGRHLYNAARFGAEMIGVDFSTAIDAAYKNVRHLNNVHLVQGDIYNLPFKKNVFDFMYSIGVLHHLPDPEKGFRSLPRFLKPGGSIFIWIYSNRRKNIIRLLETARGVTRRMPYGLLKILCFGAALLETLFFIQPYKFLRRIPAAGNLIERITFPRIKLYAQYPFQVSVADWFDRLSAPVRFYYSYKDTEKWFDEAGLKNIRVSATGLYGWRGYGERDSQDRSE